jgi:SAM-dependent methyltransferase
VSSTQRWLEAVWPLALDRLPSAPARVVEIGCGAHGGFVPKLRASGYDAIGVDPRAPEGREYRRVEFERVGSIGQPNAVVASASLHHLTDPAAAVDRVASSLAPGGTMVVIEWDWERFDATTAEWCFQRLARDDGAHWLHRHHDAWTASGQAWQTYLAGWAHTERIHAAGNLLRLLDERFERAHLGYGPYLFADLAGTAMEEEQAAIDAGRIQAMRVDYVGRLR